MSNICGNNCPNYNLINRKKADMENSGKFDDLSNVYKILSDPTRLKIVCKLLNTEISVNDLSNILNINRTTVSHQLRILRDNSLVKYRQVGKEKYYSLVNAHIEQIILQGIDHIS
ncbi:MAG TPA: metalloregulator ArsR/SmtB family transcription factor [Bacilli bacterium]|nr:metalloregulator ArsR/SmtB family transcription factor [Bacilli bacterium]